jgi:hypothetical protein
MTDFSKTAPNMDTLYTHREEILAVAARASLGASSPSSQIAVPLLCHQGASR